MSVIITQLVVVAINAYCALTERKKNIYVVTCALNVSQLVMYLAKGDMLTVVGYVIISVRSILYIFKDRFKTQIVPWCCISVQLIVGLFLLESPWQLLSVISPCFTAFYMWYSKTTQHLRVGNIISNSAWLIYNLHDGLYIVCISRVVTITSNIVGYVRKVKADREE